MNIKNKVIVVTGGSDGIGRHICLRLAKAGAKLAILGRNVSRLNAVKQECLEAASPHVEVYACDICESENVEATLNKVLDDFNGVDILINNAGIWHKAAPLDQIDSNVLKMTIQTNLTALIEITKHFIPRLREKPEAIILNIVSKSGVVAQAGQSVYSATKYGVRGFTEVLKQDEAETGIRVAGIYQSGTNTQMFAKADENVPNDIFTEPQDLAEVVHFMLTQPPKIWLHDVRIEI